MKRSTKKLLYFIFIILMVVSAVVCYIEFTKEPEEPEIYQSTPSEIKVEDTDYEEIEVNNSKFKLAPDVDFAQLRRQHNNNDIIGRLEIPGLFNVLVVKGTDLSYYLNHSVDKQYDIRGTEFLDYRNRPTDKQINIYGHNTRDPNIKVAFLKLEKYLDINYMNANPYIIFQYDGGKALYEIISLKEVDEGNREHMTLTYEGDAFLKHMGALTSPPGDGYTHVKRNVKYDANSEILVLQTCSHHKDNAIYTITAVKLNYIF